MAADWTEDTGSRKSSKMSLGMMPHILLPKTPTETLACGDPLWKPWVWFLYRHDWNQVQFKFSHRSILVKLEEEEPERYFNTALISATLIEDGNVLGMASFERLKRSVFAKIFLGHRFRTRLHLAPYRTDSGCSSPSVEMTFVRHNVEDCWIEGVHTPVQRIWESYFEIYDCASFQVRLGNGHCELRIKEPKHLVHASFLATILWRHSRSVRPSS